MSSKLPNAAAANLLSKMYLRSELADVHFVFPNDDRGEKLPAHRVILASESSVFNAMLFGPLKEREIVKITDSTARAFKEFLQFFYLPEVTLSIENIGEVVRLADKYDVLEYFEPYAAFLEDNLTIENMLWGYQLAITLDDAQLKEFCEMHIQQSVSEMIKSPMFLHCSHDVIEHILKLDTLECDGVQLFNACIEWAKKACQTNGLDATNSVNLKNQFGSCFYMIPFSSMKSEQIVTILKSKLITKDELADILRLRRNNRPKSNLFSHHPRLTPVYMWDRNKILVANQVPVPGHPEMMSIHKQESTWFSSNHRVVLGKIDTIRLAYSPLSPPTFNIRIVEHEEGNFTTDARTKLLYLNKNINIEKWYTLPKAIAIQPRKMYEIRFEYSSHKNIAPRHRGGWEVSEVKLDDNISIGFHRHPSELNNPRRGLVTDLHFNRIE